MNLADLTFNGLNPITSSDKKPDKNTESSFSEKLLNYIKRNLLQMGHRFEETKDLIIFCKSRITCLKTRKENEMYIDYEENRKFVGSFTSNNEYILFKKTIVKK